MTDEKRIEEIRARHFDMLADLDLIDEDDWDDMSAEELPLLDPRAVEPDLAFLLAALDAERARAVRAEAERDAALAEVDRVTSIANINATNVDASQAECASLRVRMEKAEAERDAALTEVARLREAMPSEEELRLCMECVSEADHLHTHWDVVDGWLDRIEKARGG